VDNNRTNKGRTAIRPILNRSGDNRNLRDNSNRMAQHQEPDGDDLYEAHRDEEQEKAMRTGILKPNERRYDE